MSYESIVLMSYVVGCVAFATALVALYLYPRLIYNLQLVCIYVVIASCSEMLALAFANVAKSNIFIYHFYVLLEFFFLSIFFYQEFRRFKKRIPLRIILISGISLIVSNSIFIQSLDTFNSYSATLVSLVILGYCIYYFVLSLEGSNKNQLVKTLKWIVISIFLYHCVSIVVLLFSNVVMQMDVELQANIWGLRIIILLIIKLILLFQFIRMMKFDFSKIGLINDGQ